MSWGGGRIVLKSACLLDYSQVNRRNKDGKKSEGGED